MTSRFCFCSLALGLLTVLVGNAVAITCDPRNALGLMKLELTWLQPSSVQRKNAAQFLDDYGRSGLKELQNGVGKNFKEAQFYMAKVKEDKSSSGGCLTDFYTDPMLFAAKHPKTAISGLTRNMLLAAAVTPAIQAEKNLSLKDSSDPVVRVIVVYSDVPLYHERDMGLLYDRLDDDVSANLKSFRGDGRDRCDARSPTLAAAKALLAQKNTRLILVTPNASIQEQFETVFGNAAYLGGESSRFGDSKHALARFVRDKVLDFACDLLKTLPYDSDVIKRYLTHMGPRASAETTTSLPREMAPKLPKVTTIDSGEVIRPRLPTETTARLPADSEDTSESSASDSKPAVLIEGDCEVVAGKKKPIPICGNDAWGPITAPNGVDIDIVMIEPANESHPNYNEFLNARRRGRRERLGYYFPKQRCGSITFQLVIANDNKADDTGCLKRYTDNTMSQAQTGTGEPTQSMLLAAALSEHYFKEPFIQHPSETGRIQRPRLRFLVMFATNFPDGMDNENFRGDGTDTCQSGVPSLHQVRQRLEAQNIDFILVNPLEQRLAGRWRREFQSFDNYFVYPSNQVLWGRRFRKGSKLKQEGAIPIFLARRAYELARQRFPELRN